MCLFTLTFRCDPQRAESKRFIILSYKFQKRKSTRAAAVVWHGFKWDHSSLASLFNRVVSAHSFSPFLDSRNVLYSCFQFTMYWVFHSANLSFHSFSVSSISAEKWIRVALLSMSMKMLVFEILPLDSVVDDNNCWRQVTITTSVCTSLPCCVVWHMRVVWESCASHVTCIRLPRDITCNGQIHFARV